MQKPKMRRINKHTDMDESMINVLVSHDSTSKNCAAIPVPQKGLDHEEYSVREALRYLDFRSDQRGMVKTEQGRSLNAVVKRVKQ